MFEPYRLQIIGQIIGLAAIGGLVIRPLWKLGQFFWVPGRLEQVKKERLRISVAVVGAAILAFLFLPLPYRIFCTLDVEARDAKTVYVEAPGSLFEVNVYPGKEVKKGDVLARLKNMDIEANVAELQGRYDQLDAELTSLRRQSPGDSQATGETANKEELLDSYFKQLQQKKRELDELVLTAPINGFVIPPIPLPEPQADDSERLPSWWGTPLEKRNLGAYLKAGVPFCQIGDPKKMQANMIIDQADIELVAAKTDESPGSHVVIKLDELPSDTFTSEVIGISKKDMKNTPRELSHKSGGDLQTKTDPTTGTERPLNPSYEAMAALDNDEGLLRVGLRGGAKVSATRWISLGGRVWRWFGQTFHFRM